MSVRVLVAEHYTLVRQAIVQVISHDKDIEVIGEACSGPEAVIRSLELRPDVVLMELDLPDLDGLKAARHIREALPDVRVFVLAASDKQEDIQWTIQAGVNGYILRNTESEDLIHEIKERKCASDTVVSGTGWTWWTRYFHKTHSVVTYN